MDGLGTITWEKFLDDVEAIVRTSDKIGDGWELVGDKSVPGMAYISRQVKTHVPCDYPIDEPTNREEDDWLENLESGMAKDPFEAASKAERPLIILHHVLWSISYSVPVLYFNGWKSDFPGCNPISVEVAQKLTKNDQVLGYSELSQAIHPILGTPFLQLHPCKSQELLQHFSKSCNKVVSWLSAAAPVALQYKLHEDYYKLTIRTNEV